VRIVTLASGSGGNATLVESGGTRVLVDAGVGPFFVRAALERLERAFPEGARDDAAASAGAVPEAARPRRSTLVDAVVITHAHQDHFGYARKYARKARVPVHVSEATCRAHDLAGVERFVRFSPREAFQIGALRIAPVPVPHDAPQVALTLSDGVASVGLATDVGEVTGPLVEHLAGCDVVLLESNHDVGMLERGPYPSFLKRRVGSARGHLSNEQAASLLRALSPRTRAVALLHLSTTNNLVELALASARDALAGRRVVLRAAPPRETMLIDASAPAPAPLPGPRPMPWRDRRRPAGAPLAGQLSLFPAG
jgi:phosphoribosyl 1,2-cyclic phosphodiesterase